MAATIKAYTSYSESRNTHYYTTFKIVDFESFNKDDYYKVEEVRLDCEQGDSEVYNYEYFRVEDYEENVEYIAISLCHDHDIKLKSYPANIQVFINDSGIIDPSRLSIHINTDGLEFDDSDDLDDWIEDVISEKILSEVPSCTDDELLKLAEDLKFYLDKYVK